MVLPVRVVLVSPPTEVLYGIQRGAGSSYEVDFAQMPSRGDVTFDFTIIAKPRPDGAPDFRGEHVQGPIGRRFIYVDVGRYAKQHNTEWARRMILRLDELTWRQVEQAAKPGNRLEARIAGTHKDGGPNCATRPADRRMASRAARRSCS